MWLQDTYTLNCVTIFIYMHVFMCVGVYMCMYFSFHFVRSLGDRCDALGSSCNATTVLNDVWINTLWRLLFMFCFADWLSSLKRFLGQLWLVKHFKRVCCFADLKNLPSLKVLHVVDVSSEFTSGMWVVWGQIRSLSSVVLEVHCAVLHTSSASTLQPVNDWPSFRARSTACLWPTSEQLSERVCTRIRHSTNRLCWFFFFFIYTSASPRSCFILISPSFCARGPLSGELSPRSLQWKFSRSLCRLFSCSSPFRDAVKGHGVFPVSLPVNCREIFPWKADDAAYVVLSSLCLSPSVRCVRLIRFDVETGFGRPFRVHFKDSAKLNWLILFAVVPRTLDASWSADYAAVVLFCELRLGVEKYRLFKLNVYRSVYEGVMKRLRLEWFENWVFFINMSVVGQIVAAERFQNLGLKLSPSSK